MPPLTLQHIQERAELLVTRTTEHPALFEFPGAANKIALAIIGVVFGPVTDEELTKQTISDFLEQFSGFDLIQALPEKPVYIQAQAWYCTVLYLYMSKKLAI